MTFSAQLAESQLDTEGRNVVILENLHFYLHETPPPPALPCPSSTLLALGLADLGLQGVASLLGVA